MRLQNKKTIRLGKGVEVGYGVYKKWRRQFSTFVVAIESQMDTLLKHKGNMKLWASTENDFEYYLMNPREMFRKLNLLKQSFDDAVAKCHMERAFKQEYGLLVDRSDVFLYFRLLGIPQVGALKQENYNDYYNTFMLVIYALYESKIQIGAKTKSGCGVHTALTVLITGSYSVQQKLKRQKADDEDMNASGRRGNLD